MNCEQVLLYASGEIPAEEKQAFEAHLRACPACQEELALWKRVETMTPPAAPARAVDKLFAQTTRRPHGFLSGWKAVLAGVAACGLIGLYVMPRSTSVNTEREVMTYLSENMDADYQNFGKDLALFEQEF